MPTRHTTTIVFVCIACFGSSTWDHWANAERLSRSDLNSTLQPHCDRCWEPAPMERAPNHLPTFTPRRPPRPPDSRPHRIPKGGYTLGPEKKQARSSSYRSRLRNTTRFADTQQVVVIDGDTIRIGSQRIRLRSLDAPELSEPDGWAAKLRLEELLRDGSIEIVPHGRDVYDRLVADVLVNGQNVAEALEREGFAKSKLH